MSKFLILGKNGNLGRTFLNLLPQDSVTAWDADELDITDQNAVLRKLSELKPDVVINCAAYTAVDKAESEFSIAEKINGTAVGYMAEACAANNAILVHFSTGMVFAGTSPYGYNENSSTSPINAYGKSKLAGEQLIKEKLENFYIIRTEWLYAKPDTDAGKKSFIEIMLDLAQTRDYLEGVIDEIGKPTWAKDIAKATIELLQSKQPFGVYHLTNSGQASRKEWAEEIFKIAGLDVIVNPVHGEAFPRPAKRPQFELLNNTKLPELRSWQEALREYLGNL